MNQDLILLSGGLDSTTLLADRVSKGTAELALSVNYGQRHVRELLSAADVAAHYNIPLVELDLSGWGALLTGSALTDPKVKVPHGHYADPIQRATVVPNRNAVLLTTAAGVAISHGCTHVLTAVHAGDHHVYADCRPEFVDAINYAVGLATGEAVTIEAPFSNLDKNDIAALAVRLGVPIGLTWSCYEGDIDPCRKCGACIERAESLAHAKAAA